ncbi:hypothetical protein IFM89_024865 [Coptis chinensis]|uniref:Exocyst complex component Sec8 n=1 Tax=Coptis chinensis TaxID=261450 RepID=A0A835HRZ2_9MAGN|nr:hypothetical protein IFM89_024865 [Coptis chinensis]
MREKNETWKVEADLDSGLGDGFYRPGSIDGGSSYDGHDEDNVVETLDGATPDGYTASAKVNGDGDKKDVKVFAPNSGVACIFHTKQVPSRLYVRVYRDGSDDGLTFAFCFTDVMISIPNQGSIQEGPKRRYGTAAVLPEQGIYLAACIYRPVLQFTDKVAFSSWVNPIGPAAFRPQAHGASTYSPLIEKGCPVLQGLLAIDFLSKEGLGWAHAMPKYAGVLVKYVQTFLERTYERCRTSYMESYMLIGRHDVEGLMRLDPSSACLPNSSGQLILENNGTDAVTVEVEIEMSDLLLSLRPIKQTSRLVVVGETDGLNSNYKTVAKSCTTENLIRDDNKLILLASLSDSLEYVADSIERLGQTSLKSSNQAEENQNKGHRHTRMSSAAIRDLASFAEEYRRLAIDCLKVLRVEMQLETIFHMQEMTSRGYVEDQDAEESDDFIISLTAQALAAIPSVNGEAVQQRLDHVRTYYELLNLPFEVQVPGREIPGDAEKRVSEILSH